MTKTILQMQEYMMKTKMFSLQNYAQVLFFMLILQTSMKLCTRNYLQIWISYIVCNFMYLLLELMHNDDICNWFEAISNYYQDMAHAHAAVYEEACDNPDDFA